MAIKILYGDDTEAINDELRFCLQLNHPSIVRTYRVLAVGDTTWVVSEYCENGDLFGAILPMEGVGDERRCVHLVSTFISCASLMVSLSCTYSMCVGAYVYPRHCEDI